MVYFKIEIGVGCGKRTSNVQKASLKEEPDGWVNVSREVERMRAEGRFKTAANYLTAAKSWMRFKSGEMGRISDMNADEMALFQRWLTSQGVCLNTISAYMRCLRALYNRVMSDGGIKVEANPFAKVFTGRDRTRKRSVTEDVVTHLRQLPLPEKSSLDRARDYFLFGFMAMGMPFVDMAYLKKSQVKDGFIHYTRHKTGQAIVVAVSPQMADIMRRATDESSDYVFPILNGGNAESLHQQYRRALRRYNYALRRLSDKVGARPPLSSYVVRHSWASIAYQHHLDIELIGKALGHTSSSTTMIYIKSLFDKDLATANEALMDALGL